MPRSMALFRNQGMDPIPAPTDFLVKKGQRFGPGIFFPGAGELVRTERAVYEYLGMAWARLRRQM
jgi:uncharacterized SAM-binding protein YcdF (DUF218 family)